MRWQTSTVIDDRHDEVSRVGSCCLKICEGCRLGPHPIFRCMRNLTIGICQIKLLREILVLTPMGRRSGINLMWELHDYSIAVNLMM